MILRRQLPAWSPITLGALAGALRPSPDALSRVTARLVAEFQSVSVLLAASGTAALSLAFLAAAPAGARPRIGLPAWGCYDLMTAADGVEADVLLYDLDPTSLAPELASVSQVLARQLHAIVVVSWFGIPVSLEPLTRLAQAAGTVVIDDAAQATGASIGGKPVGAGGDFGVLSFGRGKGRTGGEGGALLSRTEEADARMRRAAARIGGPNGAWRAYAALWAQWALGRPGLYGIPAALPWLRLGETVYRASRELRPMAPRSAAVVDRVWAQSLEEAVVRGRHALRWQQLLGASRSLELVTPPREAVPGWLRYPVLAGDLAAPRLDSGAARRHGVLRGYPRPLGEMPVRRARLATRDGAFPGARTLSKRLFTFPTHSKVAESDFMAIARLCE